jgi:RNA polymerase sigma-B factor
VSPAEAPEILAVRVARGDDAAAEQLVAAMGPLLTGMARRFEGRVPRADLEQAGAIGLLRAARSFDPEQGTPFGGYAAPFVMGEMLSCVRQLATPVRVPRGVADDERRVTDAVDDLVRRGQRGPTVDEIAEHTGLDEDAVLEVLRARRAASPVPLEEVSLTAAGIEDDEMRQVEERLALGSRLQQLDRRSRTVIVLRFGLELSQREIADRLGISQMHVSRLLRAALADLEDSDGPVSG